MDKNNGHTHMRYLTPAQAAERLMVSPVTLRHWALAGKLAFTTTPGGHRRFTLEEVERFAAEFSLEGTAAKVAANAPALRYAATPLQRQASRHNFERAKRRRCKRSRGFLELKHKCLHVQPRKACHHDRHADTSDWTGGSYPATTAP